MKNKTRIFLLSMIFMQIGATHPYADQTMTNNLTTAQVKLHNNAPALLINGEPVPPLFFFAHTGNAQHEGTIDLVWDEFEIAAKKGIDLYSASIFIPLKDAENGFRDFTDLDNLMHKIIEINPKALVVLRIWGSGTQPRWFHEKYPEEKMLFEDGSTYMDFCSLASIPWLEETLENIKAFINHINNSAYKNHVIGYHPAHLNSDEWFYPQWEQGLYADFSEPMRRAFVEHVRNKYSTVEKLQEAWNNSDITFETIQVPLPEDRTKANHDVFYTKAKGSYVHDYYELHNAIVADVIIEFAKTIKEETDNRCLTIFFYGYTFELAGNFRYRGVQNSGHYALNKLLSSPYVDAFSGPISYFERGLDGGSYFMAPVDSIIANGKLWFNEDDTRTHLAPENAEFGRVDNLDETIQVIRRNFSNMITHGAACWWMDLPGMGWWLDDALFNEMSNLIKIYNTWMSETPNRSFQPEVAIIVDEKSAFTQSADSIHLMFDTLYLSRPEFLGMGTSFGYYLLSDLVNGVVPECKLYIFLNTFDMNSDERQYIDKNLKSGNKTLVWLYASGYLKDGIPDIQHIRSLTDFYIETILDEPLQGITVFNKNTSSPITQNHHNDVFGYEGDALRPAFIIEDDDVENLGFYADSSYVSFAVKQLENWNSIFIGNHKIDKYLLHNICKFAGVHIFTEPWERGFVYANSNILGLYSTENIIKTVKLPRISTVKDVFEGKIIAENTDQFEIELHRLQTKMFSIK